MALARRQSIPRAKTDKYILFLYFGDHLEIVSDVCVSLLSVIVKHFSSSTCIDFSIKVELIHNVNLLVLPLHVDIRLYCA